MACALAVGSASEFRHWLGLYARTLAKGGCDVNLRLLVDMLLLSHGSMDATAEVTTASNCWWLSKAARVLNLDRKTLIKTIVIPEMSKNRALQRLTNEIDMEIKN
jgi:protein HIRA/HIR1